MAHKGIASHNKKQSISGKATTAGNTTVFTTPLSKPAGTGNNSTDNTMANIPTYSIPSSCSVGEISLPPRPNLTLSGNGPLQPVIFAFPSSISSGNISESEKNTATTSLTTPGSDTSILTPNTAHHGDINRTSSRVTDPIGHHTSKTTPSLTHGVHPHDKKNQKPPFSASDSRGHTASPSYIVQDGSWTLQSILSKTIGNNDDTSSVRLNSSRFATSREEPVSVRFQQNWVGAYSIHTINIAYENGFQIWDISDLTLMQEICSFRSSLTLDILQILDVFRVVPESTHHLTSPYGTEALLFTESTESTFDLVLINLKDASILHHVRVGKSIPRNLQVTATKVFCLIDNVVRVYRTQDLFLIDEIRDISLSKCHYPESLANGSFAVIGDIILYATTTRSREFHDIAETDLNLYKTAVDLAQGLVKGAVTIGSWGRDIYQGYMKSNSSDRPRLSISPPRSRFLRDGNSDEKDPGWIACRQMKSKSNEIAMSRPIHGFRAHKYPISFMQFDDSGLFLFTSCQGGTTICVWDLSFWLAQPDKHHPVCFLRLEKGITDSVVRHVALSADHLWISVLTTQGTVHLYVLETPLESIASTFQFSCKKSDLPNTCDSSTRPQPTSISPATKLYARSPIEVLRNAMGMVTLNTGNLSTSSRSDPKPIQHTRSRSSEDFEHLDVVQVDSYPKNVTKAVQFLSSTHYKKNSSWLPKNHDGKSSSEQLILQHILLWNPEDEVFEIHALQHKISSDRLSLLSHSANSQTSENINFSSISSAHTSASVTSQRIIVYDLNREETWPELSLSSTSLDNKSCNNRHKAQSQILTTPCSYHRQPSLWMQRQCKIEAFDPFVESDLMRRATTNHPTMPERDNVPWTKPIYIHPFSPQPYQNHHSSKVGTIVQSELSPDIGIFSRSAYPKLNPTSLHHLADALDTELDRPPPCSDESQKEEDVQDDETGFSLLQHA